MRAKVTTTRTREERRHDKMRAELEKLEEKRGTLIQRQNELKARLGKVRRELEYRSGALVDRDGPRYRELLSVRERRKGITEELNRVRTEIKEIELQQAETKLLGTDQGKEAREALDQLISEERSYNSALNQAIATIEAAVREVMSAEADAAKARQRYEAAKRATGASEVLAGWETKLDLPLHAGQRNGWRPIAIGFIGLVRDKLFAGPPEEPLRRRLERAKRR